MQKEGFFDLRTPADLLKKLRHDFERCRRNPLDTYAAFDFVVTGTQLHDWASKQGLTERRPTEPLHALAFKLCGALGNGAKHFSMRERRPPGHETRPGVFGSKFWRPGVWARGTWDEGDLVVHLDADEAVANNGNPSITIVELGALVLAYWEEIIL